MMAMAAPAPVPVQQRVLDADPLFGFDGMLMPARITLRTNRVMNYRMFPLYCRLLSVLCATAASCCLFLHPGVYLFTSVALVFGDIRRALANHVPNFITVFWRLLRLPDVERVLIHWFWVAPFLFNFYALYFIHESGLRRVWWFLDAILGFVLLISSISLWSLSEFDPATTYYGEQVVWLFGAQVPPPHYDVRPASLRANDLQMRDPRMRYFLRTVSVRQLVEWSPVWPYAHFGVERFGATRAGVVSATLLWDLLAACPKPGPGVFDKMQRLASTTTGINLPCDQASIRSDTVRLAMDYILESSSRFLHEDDVVGVVHDDHYFRMEPGLVPDD